MPAFPIMTSRRSKPATGSLTQIAMHEADTGLATKQVRWQQSR
jgi:hypothetical protein